MTDRFPEFAPLADFLPPGTVLDGEVLAWESGAAQPLPFAALQTRIGRKTVSRSVLKAAPARFLAYDLLEAGEKTCATSPSPTAAPGSRRCWPPCPQGCPLRPRP